MGCHYARARSTKKSCRKKMLSLGEVYLTIMILNYDNIGIRFALMSIVLHESILSTYFKSKGKILNNTALPTEGHFHQSDFLHFIFTDYISILIILAGDVETHPGPSVLNSKDLSICHINSQSLRNKIDLIAVELGSYDIVTVSETWLDQSIDSSEILIPNYQVPIRLDRNGRGGGVAAYFKQSIPYIEKTELTLAGVEAIWAEVILNKKKLLIGTFYIHPRFDRWDLVETSIENAINYCPDILLLGDFNENMLVPGQCRNIRNIMNMFNLNQLVDSPTRITQISSTLIDLVLASDNLCCTRKGIIEPFCSDHCGIHVSTNFMKINQHSFKRKIWLYDNADFDLYRESLEVCDWNLAELTVDEYVNKITSNIMQSAEVSIPNKMVTIRPRDPPWMNNTIRRAIREKINIIVQLKD